MMSEFPSSCLHIYQPQSSLVSSSSKWNQVSPPASQSCYMVYNTVLYTAFLRLFRYFIKPAIEMRGLMSKPHFLLFQQLASLLLTLPLFKVMAPFESVVWVFFTHTHTEFSIDVRGSQSTHTHIHTQFSIDVRGPQSEAQLRTSDLILVFFYGNYNSIRKNQVFIDAWHLEFSVSMHLFQITYFSRGRNH